MANWLTTATQALQRRPPAEPPKFEVRCGCGHEVSGVRTSAPQQANCSRCGETLFILPISVYPPVREPKKKKTAPTSTTTTAAKTTVQGTKIASPAISRRRFDFNEPLAAGKLWVRKQATPMRLVWCGLLLVIGTTSYWMIRTRTLRQAEQYYLAAVHDGTAALDEEDFLEAARQFGIAVRALDLLGRSDGAARWVRQQERESRAVSNLAVHTLPEIAGNVLGKKVAGEESDSPDLFKGTWVIIEATVSRREPAAESDSETASARYVVDYPLIANDHPIEVVADLHAFDKLDWSAGPRPVVFAAQVQEVRVKPTDVDTWQIVLESESGFLWSRQQTFLALGFQDHEDSPTAAILAEQSRILEIEAP